MRTSTLQEFTDKIKLEQDLQEESFISPTEMINYVNEGIDWAESIVIGLYEDYYLDRTEWLTVVSESSLPDNIYANKLRKVEVTGDLSVPVRSIQIFKNTNLSDTHVGYNIFHKFSENPKIVFENLPETYRYYRLTFTRNANRVVNPLDVIDLPEIALYYAQQFVKIRCQQKERDSQSFKSSEEIAMMGNAMIDTLTNITNDGSEQIEADLSFYSEFDQEF